MTDPRADMDDSTAHRVMTPEEYSALKLIGWHSVCKNVDGLGSIGIRYQTAEAHAPPLPDREEIARALDAVALFFRLLRGSSNMIPDGYQLHISKTEYDKAQAGYKALVSALATSPPAQADGPEITANLIMVRNMLAEAASPFVPSSGPDNEWLARRDRVVANATAAIPDPAEAGTTPPVWPAGCHSPNFCDRNQRCMYVGCKHDDDGLPAKIQAAKDRSAP